MLEEIPIMEKEIVFTGNAMRAIGPYNQAVKVGNFVFTAGQLGISPQTNKLMEGLDAQAAMTFNNMNEVLHAAGAHRKDLVKINIYLKDMKDFEKINELMKAWLKGTAHPARTCIQAVELPKGCLFLMDAVAFIQDK